MLLAAHYQVCRWARAGKRVRILAGREMLDERDGGHAVILRRRKLQDNQGLTHNRCHALEPKHSLAERLSLNQLLRFTPTARMFSREISVP